MYSKTILIGHIGNVYKPETENQPLKLSVATKRSWKKKGETEWQEETQWHNIILFNHNGLGDKVEKGNKVFVEGEIAYSEYTNKEGLNVKKTEIRAMKVMKLDKTAKTDSQDNSQDVQF